MEHRGAIRAVIEDRAVWRDVHDLGRFDAAGFIAAWRAGLAREMDVVHLLGGKAIDALQAHGGRWLAGEDD